MYLTGRIEMEMAKEFAKELGEKLDLSEVVININTEGGDVYAMDLIITALNQARKSGLYVTMNCSGMIASAGIPIVMQASQIIVNNSLWMVHKIATEIDGNANDYKKILHVHQHFDNIIYNSIEQLLTESEKSQFKNGEDVYFTPNEEIVNMVVSGS